jgi:hypothetical protein
MASYEEEAGSPDPTADSTAIGFSFSHIRVSGQRDGISSHGHATQRYAPPRKQLNQSPPH